MFVTVRVEVISGKLETEILLNVSTIDVTAEGTTIFNYVLLAFCNELGTIEYS